jgi:hypothetical protein
MSNLAEYFEANRPKPRYLIGQRVEGTYKGVPWVGTVGCDNLRNYDEGPRVTIHLDLPLKAEGQWHHTVIRVSYRDIKGLRT